MRQESAPTFLLGGGEMGARMRDRDWSQTALGPAERWPQSLKTAVRIMLTSRQPMFVWWGEELVNLYNDAYRAIVGGKHPEALGQPASVVWREIWDQVGPRAESALRKNEGTYDEALLLIMERHGYPEETYYTFSYSPVPDDAGGTGGILCANTDDTRRILGERQLALLRDLAAGTADARTFEEACARSAVARLRKEAAAELARLLASANEARLQAETANRLKDEFLATLSHELRTPLNAILGWAQLLQVSPHDEAGLRRALATIERNARIQSQLIEDLLDVSRVITGQLRLDLRPVDLASVIQEAIEVVRPAAENKGVRIEAALDPLASPVSGDPGRLQQVVWNVLANAVKFTPRGGHVQVRLLRGDSAVEIVVADTGIGIKPEFLPYVFERFRQADASTSRLYGGLGLGLAIVRHLVDLHGGTVRVESPGEGQGATFAVSLPMAPPPAALPFSARAC